uniref:Calmodulin-binding domain-containing protein n=1 Tax=Vitis vinifera TaxID=29760 RepID=F6H5M1_VITVI
MTKPGGGNIRRNSTGTPFFLSSGEKPVPHYLRASIGSCHDFCKYGRKHAFEAKARSPIRKINITSQPPDAKNPVDKVVQAERKRATMVKLKPSPNSKAGFPQSTKIIKLEVSSPSKKVEVSLKHASANARGITDVSSTMNKVEASSKRAPPNARGITQNAKHTTPVKLKPMAVKPLASPDPLKGSSGRRNSDINIGPKTGISKVLVSPAARLSPKHSVDVASLDARKNRSLDVNLNRTRKAEIQPPDDGKVIEKTLYVVMTDTDNKTLGSAPDGSPTIKLSPSPSLSPAESSSQPTSPSLSSQEEEDQGESEYTISDADDFILEDNETGNMNEAENSEGEYKRRPQKAGLVHSEDEECSAVKLNFRRGKVLDLHSENKGPRRLRFRRGKLLGENQNGKNDAGRRSFKRRGVDGDTNGTKDESEKVVLRHQDVQGKKDAQGLLNNVIEETASKLVETRKSKVKALVGAFETVISLQETKPSTNTVT